ncbi:hypothetical protein GCM10011346_43190 [Oceanobacillus neutriphilus]|uniref:Uncharacterized protein n=1 Tax=Oceanobacillus neutriphilus TaxID=531815 RepID=A0ABQ2P0T1_9BACI|nr:hypothetical protein GCM10011346_43190 [Oceanobacillus neutriphilus]
MRKMGSLFKRRFSKRIKYEKTRDNIDIMIVKCYVNIVYIPMYWGGIYE